MNDTKMESSNKSAHEPPAVSPASRPLHPTRRKARTSAMTDASPSPMIPYVVTLGTAGGPRWWKDHEGTPRFGIATAVVVGEAWYLVDCGQGAGRQANAAGLSMS